MNKKNFGLILGISFILMVAYGYYIFNTMLRKDLEEKKSHVETPFN